MTERLCCLVSKKSAANTVAGCSTKQSELNDDKFDNNEFEIDRDGDAVARKIRAGVGCKKLKNTEIVDRTCRL